MYGNRGYSDLSLQRNFLHKMVNLRLWQLIIEKPVTFSFLCFPNSYVSLSDNEITNEQQQTNYLPS